MSDLTFALLIVGVCAAPILLPLLGLAGHRVYAMATGLRPSRPVAYDERDLLHTDPREWVRQAERTVEAEQDGAGLIVLDRLADEWEAR